MDYALLNKQIENTTANFNNLSQNLVMAAANVKQSVIGLNSSIEDSSFKLTVAHNLNAQIKIASEASEKQAEAMKRWTIILVVLTIIIAILTIALVVVGIIPLLYKL